MYIYIYMHTYIHVCMHTHSPGQIFPFITSIRVPDLTNKNTEHPGQIAIEMKDSELSLTRRITILPLLDTLRHYSWI